MDNRNGVKNGLFIAIGTLLSVVLSAALNFIGRGLNSIEVIPLHEGILGLAALWLLVMLILTIKSKKLEGRYKGILVCLYLWAAILGLTAFSGPILNVLLHFSGLVLGSISIFLSLRKRQAS